MKQIFHHLFAPNYKKLCHSPHYVSTMHANLINARTVRLRIHPLTNGTFQAEEVRHIRHVILSPNSWRTFHDEMFRKELNIPFANYTINHREWHPHLASCLLKTLVMDLYRESDATLKLDSKFCSARELPEGYLTYLVECLPYAETTSQNLDALRAIVYLFGKVDAEWDIPEQFWICCRDFLKVSRASVFMRPSGLTINNQRYDPSYLSSEELHLFEQWLDRVEGKSEADNDFLPMTLVSERARV